MCQALSTPIPCSPVSEPPASMQTVQDLAGQLPRPGRPGPRPTRRTAPAGAGCRRRRGTRWRPAARRTPTARRSGEASAGSAGPRHHAVLHVVVGADPAHRRERRLAAVPERRPLGLVGGDRDLAAPCARQIACTCSREQLDLGGGPSSSTSSTAPAPTGSPACTASSIASIASVSIISMAAGTMPAAMICDTTSPASSVEPKPGQQRHHPLGQRQHPDHHLGDDPQRALGAHEPGDQVERPVTLQRDQLAVGQHHLELEHVVGREAVLEAVRAAGVLGDVAADRAHLLAGRVGRVVEAVAGDRRLTSRLVTPGCTRARRLGTSTSRIRFIRARPMTMPSAIGIAPPESPVPAPRATNGTPWAAHTRTAATTSAVERGSTTASGIAR